MTLAINTPKCVIAGSGKNPLYFQAVEQFRKEGFNVLAPHPSPIIPEANWNGFWLQEENLSDLGLTHQSFNNLSPEDKTNITQGVETNFIKQILELDPTAGDFLYVVTKPDSSIGASASGEIMVALQNQIPVFFSQYPIDPHYPYPFSTISSIDLIKYLNKEQKLPVMPTNEYLKFLINPRKAVGCVIMESYKGNSNIALQYRDSRGAYTLPGTLIPHGVSSYQEVLEQYLHNKRGHKGGSSYNMIGIFTELDGQYKGPPIKRDFIDYKIQLPHKSFKQINNNGLAIMGLEEALNSPQVEPNTKLTLSQLMN